MRIRHISVRGLFDTFDHEIPLNQEERVTVLLGPNGFGKTAVLRLVHALFNEDYSFRGLRAISFHNFDLKFDDGHELCISRKPDASAGPVLEIALWRDGVMLDTLRIPRERKSRTELSPWDILVQPPKPVLPADHWLSALRRQISVHLIQTERLATPAERESPEDPETEPTVRVQARELASRIEQILAHNAEVSTSLERNFPKRLLERREQSHLRVEEIQARLRELDERRARLMRLGILAPEASGEMLAQSIDEQSRSVLTVYIEDTEQKLAVFDHLADRLDLFHRIVSARFLYKKLYTNKEQGFAFTDRAGAPLDLAALSSGEQHELVLFYHLLFKVTPDTLILIDEPEISLHVAWQIEFLRDLLAAAKLSSFDALVATHSPQIVNDRWDLAVELKGPPV